MSRYMERTRRACIHGTVYRNCPQCGGRYLVLEQIDRDLAELPCGCTGRIVPTAAEKREARQ